MIFPTLHRRRPTAAAMLIVSLACAPLACKRHRRVIQTEEEAPMLASTVHTADPRSAAQLLSGFYGVEQNAWRWTAGKFAVLLRPPRNAATKGATLQLKFTIPDVIIKQLKSVTLSAAVNGTPLAPQTYTAPGQYTYSREVAASLLGGESAKVEFLLDRTMRPSDGDQRDLGIVATSAGLEAK